MPKGGKKTFSWTKIRVAFVLAWKGNDVEAAREAGCGRPESDAARLMKMPEMKAAIEKRREEMFKASAIKTGKALSKTEVITRALRLADIEVKKTKGSITGQVNAVRLLAELGGFIVKQSRDLTKELENKTEEELEFFAQNGYWPNVDAGRSGSPGSESPGPGPSKPN